MVVTSSILIVGQPIPAIYANVGSILIAWNARTEASRKAAKECSPRRQPWVIL